MPTTRRTAGHSCRRPRQGADDPQGHGPSRSRRASSTTPGPSTATARPGPVIHVRQGQTVEMTLTNGGAIPHSIDFHAARIAPNIAFKDVAPGDSITFRFKADDPGVFMYHCGTKPVLAHIANGMYGAIVVGRAKALPPVDNEYVLVASEWYLTGDGIAEPASLDMAKARARMADWVDVQRLREPVRHPPADRRSRRDHPLLGRRGRADEQHELPRRRHDLRPRLGQLRPDEPAPAGRPDGRRARPAAARCSTSRSTRRACTRSSRTRSRTSTSARSACSRSATPRVGKPLNYAVLWSRGRAVYAGKAVLEGRPSCSPGSTDAAARPRIASSWETSRRSTPRGRLTSVSRADRWSCSRRHSGPSLRVACLDGGGTLLEFAERLSDLQATPASGDR